MRALIFPSEEALHVALRAGLVPSEVQRASAQVSLVADGQVAIVPSVALSAAAAKALTASGVTDGAVGGPQRRVTCWAEALAPRRSVEKPGPLQVVLFTVAEEGTLLDVAGELLRLGCDRQSLRVGDAAGPVRGVVRVAEPPWFVVSRAVDRLDGLRAFVPSPAGQDRVWTELGYTHPLDAALEAPADGLLLVCGEGPWWRVETSGWVDVDALLQPAGLPVAQVVTATEALPPIRVSLRLARAARGDAPTLFVLTPNPDDARGPPAQQLEALVRGLPEAQLDNLLFAAAGDTVLLRARPGREASVEALPGAPYAHVLDMPNLFAPVGLTVEPPLRRDRLRTWLAPDPDVVTWLEPVGAGFARRSIADASFRPLSEWVDYVVDGASETLTAWVRSATFDFAAFAVADDLAPAAAPSTTAEAPSKPGKPRKRPEAKPSSPREAAESARPSSPTFTIEVPTGATELEGHVAQHEAAFLELDAPADSDARRKAWVALAELYAKAQRPRDAGMAWAHAVWEAPAEEVAPLARRWAETSGVRPEAVLRLPAPNVEQTRSAVAWLVASASDGEVGSTQEWTAFLERFDDDLDVRSVWLGRAALSRLSGGDALGLARARDRVLARLQRGLSLERDVPRLLRITGHMGAGGAGTERAARVGAQLEAMLKAFDETPRKRSPIEAPPHLTRAYVQFEFAWGFARLGNGDRARALRDASLATLDRTQPVHDYLCRAYAARIDQALEGASPETPLPPDVTALLTELNKHSRYHIDRLRKWSAVLEAQERIDPTGTWLRSDARTSSTELSGLHSATSPGELTKAIDARLAVAAESKLADDEKTTLLESLLHAVPRLPESSAMPALQRVVALAENVAPRHRALLLETALKTAGHFGRTAIVRQLVLSLRGLIKELSPEDVAEVANALVASVRAMRRVGLRAEASDLMSVAASTIRGDTAKTLRVRLAIAAGFTYLGEYPQAQPAIEEAINRLSRETAGTPNDRLELNLATTRALSHAPTEVALPALWRFAQQLPWISDLFSSKEFCLTVVAFADALVLGHVGDDLTLNETTRRFLEEDEFLVRRRVHRDVASGEGLR